MTEWLSRAARIGALLALGLTLFIAVNVRATTPVLAVWMSGAAIFATFLVLRQNESTRAWWISAGVWGGLSYVFEDASAFLYLIAAALTAFSAYQRERARGRFDAVGPLAFIGAVGFIVIIRTLIGV